VRNIIGHGNHATQQDERLGTLITNLRRIKPTTTFAERQELARTLVPKLADLYFRPVGFNTPRFTR
jgi:hypothetical protein